MKITYSQDFNISQDLPGQKRFSKEKIINVESNPKGGAFASRRVWFTGTPRTYRKRFGPKNSS